LTGGRGGDTFAGGRGADTADYGERSEDIVVSLDGVGRDGAAGERDNVLADVEGVNGGDGNDVITGSFRANRLFGGGGNDTLSGGERMTRLTAARATTACSAAMGSDSLPRRGRERRPGRRRRR
jgi:Ca2+-binding RTX toxin-like protein